jgi:ribonuclease HI
MKAVIYTDGGARPKNPGFAGCAFVLEVEGQEPVEFNRYLGIKTNNAAEYTALVIALKFAQARKVTEVTIYTDSKLIEGHLMRNWAANGDMIVHIRQCLELLNSFEDWSVKWIPREQNTRTDELATAAINWGRNLNPWEKRKHGKLEPAYILDPFRYRKG